MSLSAIGTKPKATCRPALMNFCVMPASGVDFEQFTEVQFASHLNMDGLDSGTIDELRSRSGCSCVADLDKVRTFYCHGVATGVECNASVCPH